MLTLQMKFEKVIIKQENLFFMKSPKIEDVGFWLKGNIDGEHNVSYVAKSEVLKELNKPFRFLQYSLEDKSIAILKEVKS